MTDTPPIVLQYGSDHEYQTLHLWLPETHAMGDVPVVVFLSGGGWSGPQGLPSAPTAGIEYLSRGFAWAQAGYAWSNMPGPLNPAIFPVPEDDARTIVSFFRGGGYSGVGGDFVALQGRSAGSFGCIWAASQPNPEGQITQPNAVVVSQLAGHWYPALDQGASSDMAKHVAWPKTQLENVPARLQITASPYTWIAQNPPKVPFHITGSFTPTVFMGWDLPPLVSNTIPIGHDGWNALALHQQLLQVTPLHAGYGSYIDGVSPVQAAPHIAWWLSRVYALSKP